MGFKEYPYTDLYNLNLDWMIDIVKRYADTIDDIPAKVKDAVEKLGESLVLSVNGESGDVILYKDQYTQLPEIEEAENPVWNFSRKVNGVLTGLQFLNNGTVELILGTQRIKFITSTDAMVSKFNNRTGEVNLTSTDVNNLRIPTVYIMEGTIDDYTPVQLKNLYNIGYRFMVQPDTETSGLKVMYVLALDNSTGIVSARLFITESGTTTTAYSPDNPPPYPVRSVNGQTGDVILDTGAVGYFASARITYTEVFTHTYQDPHITANMVAVHFELDKPENCTTKDVVISTEDGAYTISCNLTEPVTAKIVFMEV